MARQRASRTRGLWLPDREADLEWTPLAGWLTEPDEPSGLGVVILPPVGYEYSSSHRFLRSLAESVAEGGATVLRVDYAGTGDSAGHVSGIDGLEPWRSALPIATERLRALGMTKIAVIGCQWGGSFALLDGPKVGAVAIAAIEPVLSGRRFVRSFTMVGIPAPDEVGGISVGGYYFGSGVLDRMAEIRVEPPEGMDVLSITGDPRTESFLERPAEDSIADPSLIAEVSEWILESAARAGESDVAALSRLAEPRHSESASSAGEDEVDNAVVRIRDGAPAAIERFVTVGPDGLLGVLTTPVGDDAVPDELLVLVNSGSDPHSGPGRAWVELARELAIRGRSTLRLDFRGWGESPDGPVVPGRPYDAHTLGDIVTAVKALNAQGSTRIVLGGLCAGAWISLAAAREIELAGVIALNPQLYWQPGDPVEALMTTTRARRLPEIAAIKREAEAGRWNAEDAQGLRPLAGEWLDDLVRRGAPISLVFAEGDDGLEYLQDRLGRRLAESTDTGIVNVVELSGVDHGMHRTWLRQIVFDRFDHELERIYADDRHVSPGPRSSGDGT